MEYNYELPDASSFLRALIKVLQKYRRPFDKSIADTLVDATCKLRDPSNFFDGKWAQRDCIMTIFIPVAMYDDYLESDLYKNRIEELANQIITQSSGYKITVETTIKQPVDDMPYEKAQQSSSTQMQRYHDLILKNCTCFLEQNDYFHAVNEATKIFIKHVQEVSQSGSDGYKLIMQVFDENNPVIKITDCSTESLKSYQRGIKEISSGVVSAFRNPTAHEPVQSWEISREDCNDILCTLSFLLRKIDERQ